MSNLKEHVIEQILKHDKEKQDLEKRLAFLEIKNKQIKKIIKYIELENRTSDIVYYCRICDWPIKSMFGSTTNRCGHGHCRSSFCNKCKKIYMHMEQNWVINRNVWCCNDCTTPLKNEKEN